MADILSHTLDQYQLHGKVGWFTSNGAAVNRTTLWVLQDSASIETGWTAKEHDMLCMEHSLHLAAKHFVKSITPPSRDTCDTSGGDPASDDDGNKDDEDIESSDSLGKVISFMKQIHKSPQARSFSVQPAAKLGSPLLSSCYGSTLVGAHSLPSWSVSSFSNWQLPNLSFLRMQVTRCPPSPTIIATQTST